MAIEHLWERALPSPGKSCAVLRDAVAFLTADTIVAYAFTGVKAWSVAATPSLPRIAASGDVLALPTPAGLTLLSSLGSIVARVPLDAPVRSLSGGIAFAVATEDRVLAITRSGQVSWEQAGFDRPLAAAATDEGVLVALRDAVACLGDSGESLWRVEAGQPVRGLSGGSRPLLWTEGSLQALGHGGSIDWERPLSPDTAGVRSDRTVVTSGPQQLLVYSQDGDLLQELPGGYVDAAPLGPLVAAVGDASGHLFEDLEGKEVYYEILCMGEAKCGTFVSATSAHACPKCGSAKALVRVARTEGR